MFLRWIRAVLVVMMGLTFLATPAYAAGTSPNSTNAFTLALNSWPVILAGLVGVGSTHLTEVLAHYEAPQWIKSGINLALVSLGGVLITVTTIPGKNWKDYVGEIFAAWVSSLIVHATGLTAWIQNLAGNVGIGAGVQPLVPDPATTGSGEPTAEGP